MPGTSSTKDVTSELWGTHMNARSSSDCLAAEILRIVFRHRRLRHTAGDCVADPCPTCLAPHLERVKRFVLAGEPVHFVLPAFPVKSPSRRKTIGPLPDLAEELALQFLQSVCDEVGAVHRPGARITICSDGRVFSDIVGVTDEAVTRYGAEIASIVAALGGRSLDFFSLDDLFEKADFETMRLDLVERYAEPLAAIRERTRTEDAHRSLFCGVLRFLLEDRMGQGTGKTRSRLQKEAKADAYRMIQRSNAWSRLVADHFPHAVRLSIHPQEIHSEKIGIRLGETPDAWLTPWHSAVLRSQERFRLVHREEAEALGARLVYRSGHPSHYELAA
ncbi:MAG: Pyoverdine/dityrosine biosynthesis protein [Actinobacteria bacterium]|nr:Pyoverdine/dityrosine biosynthesis protein [Actinomycetota bacterium]